MSISKYFSAIGLVTSLLSGCEGLPPEGTDVQVQRLMGPPQNNGNSSQAFGGNFATVLSDVRGLYYSNVPPANSPPSLTGWWIMSASSDQFAPVDSISYNQNAVVGLSTTQGWLQVTDKSRNTIQLTGKTDFILDFMLGGTLRGMILRITAATDAATYGQYKTWFSHDGGATWDTFCLHNQLNSMGNLTPVTEYMIPIGGAKWTIHGDRVDDQAAISLSCTHDSIGGCVTWGYAPWDSAAGVLLRDHHQACTRMKRADWCGDGNPDTSLNLGVYSQTTIQVWDSLQIHPMNPQTVYTMEAAWSTNGAVCVNRDMFRSSDPTYATYLRNRLASCPKPLCSDSGGKGLTGSSRPCITASPDGSLCTAN